MGRGRRKDHAPEGYYTTSEAAAILGVTAARIRQRLDEGTLPSAPPTLLEGKEGAFAEGRRYIPKGAVDEEAAEKKLPASRGHVDTSTDRLMEKFEVFEEMARKASEERREIERAVEAQDAHIASRLDRLQENQEAMRAGLGEAIEVMRETARRQAIFQDRMIQMLDREAERQAERERRGLPERRSLWRRLFGT